MKLKHSGNHYEWWTDSFMGVGRFIRKEDNAVSDLETGMDFVDIDTNFNILFDNHEEKAQDIFDNYASEFTYEKD